MWISATTSINQLKQLSILLSTAFLTGRHAICNQRWDDLAKPHHKSTDPNEVQSISKKGCGIV